MVLALRPSFSLQRPFHCFSFRSHRFTTLSVSQVQADWPAIKQNLESQGSVCLQMEDSSRKTLDAVAQLFGAPQKHARNPKDGVTDVVGETLPENQGQVISNVEFFPHTDGHYLNGLIRQPNGKIFRVIPPRLILLQCVQPSSQGGVNALVDAQKILEAVIQRDKSLLKPLFSSEGMGVQRGEHFLMDIPIFKRLSPQHYSIRFSYDRDFIYPHFLDKIFARFNKEYILNQVYAKFHQMQKNQILIIDNQRTLHGRTSFVGQRTLHRLWLHDEEASYELASPSGSTYFETEKGSQNPLRKFSVYGPVNPEKRFENRPQIKTGIFLHPFLDQELRRCLYNP